MKNVSTGLLWAIVFALAISQFVIMMRLSRLQEAAAAGEGPSKGAEAAKPEAGEMKPEAKRPATDGFVTDMGKPAIPETAAGTQEPATRRPGEGGGRAVAMNEADVEAMIDRKLKEQEKKNPLMQLINFEDPMKVMERELQLSAGQKSQIQGYMKERDAALAELWKTATPMAEPKDWQEKSKEIHETYTANVKRTLDLKQQERYEELKKSGKLMDGGGDMAFTIMTGEAAEPAPGK